MLDAIQEYKTTIASIEKEISALELPKQWFTRQELMKEVALLQTKVKACRSLLSVKRRMPWETMGQIFEYYLLPGGGSAVRRVGDDREGEDGQEEDEDDRSTVSDSEVKNNPGVLCLVCRHWKAIATATPSLWSKIRFSAHQTTKESRSAAVVLSPQIRGIWSWMERVSAHPWELTINIEGNSGSWSMLEKVRDGVPLRQVLKRPATLHLKRFRIKGTAHSLAANGLTEMTFPEVTSAVIHSTTWYLRTADGSERLNKAAIPNLPNLTHLTFHHFRSLATDGPKSIQEQVPWSRLTHLAVGGDLDLRYWRVLFKQCVKLQKGTFALTGYIEEEDVTDEQNLIELPDLRELTTLVSSPFEEPLINMTLPSLQRLQIYTVWSQPLVDFTNPSIFANLTHLTMVSCCDLSGQYIISIVDRLPTLVELFFTMDHGLKEAYHFLTYGHEGRFKLRHLKALGMHTWYERGAGDEGVVFPFDALTSLVESRTQAVKEKRFSTSSGKLAPLEHLVLRLGVADEEDVLTPKVRESLEQFAPYGMRMTITTPCGSSRHDNSFSGNYYERTWSRVLEQWPDELRLDAIDGAWEYSLYP